MEINIVSAYEYPEEVKELFTEYTKLLIQGDSEFQEYLEIQHYDEELDDLEKKYGLPYGRLYLAYMGGELAGCIGLKKIDEHNCEMKRLYVRDKFRGNGIAKKLVQKIVKDAKKTGYTSMLLDTLPFLHSAVHMYKQMGFYEIPCYNNSPMDTSIYMKLDLADD